MSSTVKHIAAPVGGIFGGIGGALGGAMGGRLLSGQSPFGRNITDPFNAKYDAQSAQNEANAAQADSNAQLNDLLANMRGYQSNNDRSQLLSENAANTAERQATLSSQDSARSNQLSSLATLLARQNQDALGQASPQILEDLNSRGLMRSSAVGNQFADTLSNLTTNTNNQIAQQAIANQQAYTQGLGGITEADIAGKGSATQRQFSINDYANQIQAGKLIGQATAPMQPSGGKGSSGLTGALGGAGVGAKFGPWGAGIGGAAGLLLGSGKK